MFSDEEGPSSALSMDRLPDEELVDLCREGVESAFTAIYERHRRFLYSYALRLLGDADAAAAVLREVYEEFFATIGTSPIGAPLTVHLYRLARVRCVDRARDGRAPGDGGLGFSVPSVPREGTPAQKIRTMLDRLPLTYREAFYLRFVENRPYGEIAEITGAPVEALRGRLGNGLELLRGAVRAGGVEKPEGPRAPEEKPTMPERHSR